MFVLRDVFVGFNTQGLSGPGLVKELRVSSGCLLALGWGWGCGFSCRSPWPRRPWVIFNGLTLLPALSPSLLRPYPRGITAEAGAAGGGLHVPQQHLEV